MSRLPDINFSTGIRRIAKKVNPHLTCSPASVTYISSLMKYLNSSIVNICRHFTKPNLKASQEKDILLRVCKEVIKDDVLRAHALAAASRTIVHYNCGLLTFNPKATKIQARKSRCSHHEFNHRIPKIATGLLFEVPLDNVAKLSIAKTLKDVTLLSSEKAQSLSEERGVLLFQDVSSVISEIIKPPMAKHVYAAAARFLLKLIEELEKEEHSSINHQIPAVSSRSCPDAQTDSVAEQSMEVEEQNN